MTGWQNKSLGQKQQPSALYFISHILSSNAYAIMLRIFSKTTGKILTLGPSGQNLKQNTYYIKYHFKSKTQNIILYGMSKTV